MSSEGGSGSEGMEAQAAAASSVTIGSQLRRVPWRMRGAALDVDGLAQRGQRAAHGELVDDLGRLRPHDVHAEDLAGGLVGDDLHEAVGLAERDGLAAGGEWELA